MKVIGVRFKYNPKMCYYLPKKEEKYFIGQDIVVIHNNETVLTKITVVDKEIDEKQLDSPIEEVVRIATTEDLNKMQQNEKKAREGLKLAKEKVEFLNLPIKILDCEISLCGRALFHFTADDRVDFRELVHILATAMHCRIELRQISQREVVRQMGGIGNCGRACCCTQGIVNVQKISIKMAKKQGISLNMAKISGVCGKLKCCLSYEHEFYTQAMQNMPAIGTKVKTSDGEGSVVAFNILKNLISVKLQNSNGTVFKNFAPDAVSVVEGTKSAKNMHKNNIDTNLE